MSFYDAIRVGASGAADFEVERSLRFNRSETTYLNRTPSSAGNRKTWTISFWFKRCTLSSSPDGQRVFSAYNGSNGQYQSGLKFKVDDKLQIFNMPSGSLDTNLHTTRLFRDVNAWYHIVIAVDMTQSTASDRVNIYVNGVQETSFSTENYGTQNTDWWFNNNSKQSIGRDGAYLGQKIDGYLAEVNVIDGLQLTPSSFGETNSDTGQWVPIDTSGLTFGTNGFRLQFADNSGTTATTLGKDTSGNSNNYTPNGFSVSAGAGNDSVEDTPTNNFPTFNPLCENNNHTYTEGNLKVTHAANNQSGSTTSMATPRTGKWYWEVRALDSFLFIGVTADTYLGTGNVISATNTGGSTVAYYNDGQKYVGGSPSSYGASFANGDLVGVALDMDNGQVTFYKNNASQGAISLVSTRGHIGVGAVGTGQALSMSINFGQQAFTYTPPTGFKKLCSANLTEPTIKLPNKHFNILLYSGNNTNGTAITGLDFQPEWVWIKNRSGTAHHTLVDAVRGITKQLQSSTNNAESTNAANKGLQSFNNNGFTLGEESSALGGTNDVGQTYVAWNWNAGDTDSATYTVKVVSDSGNKYRFNDFGTSAVTLDLAEGGTYTFDQSDSSMSSHPMQLSTTANGTHGGGSAYSTGVTYELDGSTVTASAFISGFSSASSRKLIITVAASAPTLYYYCYYHSGMGGAVNTNSTLGSSNFDGTLQATVKANTTAGFSIITWTGNQTSGATLGHGLGVAPKAAFVKRRDGTSNWISPLFDLQTAGKLNSSDAFSNSYYNVFFTSQPSSTLITIGSNDDINRNTSTYVAYVFSEVSSYNKFGSYKGNGSSDGTFVHTGFRPAWVLISNSNAGFDWVLQDSKRSPGNVANKKLNPNQVAAEQSNYDKIDILSNGFKPRVSDAGVNANGSVYYYWAFAESPFKNSRAR